MKCKSLMTILLIAFLSGFSSLFSAVDNGKEQEMSANNYIFATNIESIEQLPLVYRLVESLRTFGGRFSKAPFWLYLPAEITITDETILKKLKALNIEIHTYRIPEDAAWFYYSGKVYAAATAETAITDENTVLIWMDSDTIILQEPEELDLAPSIGLAYRPVMHNRSGSLYGVPPDTFWSRIYKIQNLNDEILFPMITPADKEEIRAYFNCGLMAVRPEKGILRGWVKDYELLFRDPDIKALCETDSNKRIFLHQASLTGAILHKLKHNEMRELSNQYNYPIFFEKQYGGKVTFDSIEKAVTIRCLISPKNLESDWYNHLKGDPEKISWLKERLYKNN